MKANEFIKKYGIDFSKGWLSNWFNFSDGCPENNVDRSEVELLIRSYEFIESLGGIDEAITKTGMSYISPLDWQKINEAITDVESCQ